MYRLSFVILITVFSQNLFSQAYQVKWGNEFKFDKKSGDLEIIYTDNSGIYIKEAHLVVKRLSLLSATRESATLIKCDKDLNRIYTNDFNGELRGKEFERIMFLKNRLYLFATDYVRRDGMLKLYSLELDKNNGKRISEWKEIAAWEKEERGDDLDFQLNYNFDSSKMLLVSTREGNSKNNYEVWQFDENLVAASKKPVNIKNEFSPRTFVLEDVLFTQSNTVLVTASQYELENAKNKGRKFKGYSLRLYSSDGKLIKDIHAEEKNKIPLMLKVVQQSPAQLALTAFYIDVLGASIKGIMTARIDPVTGEVLGSYSREINAEISGVEDSVDNGNDSIKAPPGAGLGISRTMLFRNFIYTADNGLVVIAERFNSYDYSRTTSSQRSSMGGYSSSTNRYKAFDCDEVMVFKVGENCDIKWLKILPKFQHEVIETSSSSTTELAGRDITSAYFTSTGWNNRPYYSSIGTCISNGRILMIVNDYDVNAQITGLGQKPRRVSYLGHTLCYAISYDINDGTCTRTILFDNKAKGVPTAMPRFGRLLGREFYMVGKQDRVLGKSKVAVARIILE